MHDRHWVGRNRGKNLKYAERLDEMPFNVNPYVLGILRAKPGVADNVTDRGPSALDAAPACSTLDIALR